MRVDELESMLAGTARRKALKALTGKPGAMVTGLAGSSAAIMLAALPRPKAAPTVVVGENLDDAGYLFFDLCRLVGEGNVAFMPSGFKRDIKYGQADPANRILRTETLRRISAGEAAFIVTYPEAMAETVASQEELSSHTRHISRGEEADMNELARWLRDNGFKEVDYVYEPGQYSIRGSIFDIFAYSSELPLRLDFFGDEIDSIRAFNVETQLSDHKLDSVDNRSRRQPQEPAEHTRLYTGRIAACAAQRDFHGRAHTLHRRDGSVGFHAPYGRGRRGGDRHCCRRRCIRPEA